jgi:predicted negative regulator of RcsB-dependent stress response
MKKILKSINKLKVPVIGLAVIAALGYAGFQAYQVSNVEPAPEYLEKKKTEARSNMVKLDGKVMEEAARLEVINGATGVTAGHQSDPFSP